MIHMSRKGAEYGFSTGGAVTADMKKVKERKDRIVSGHSQSEETWLRNMPYCKLYKGHARFENSHQIRVGEELLEAGKIFINTGARASIPPLPGLDRVPYLTNSGMMEIDSLPQHLLILGGSYIGLEFGQMYRRFGAQVTIIDRSERLISREDPDISEAIRSILENEGVRVLTQAEVLDVVGSSGQVAVKLKVKGAPEEVAGSHLLVALGRRPNTDDLGLEKAGIEKDEKGYIQVDDQLRTSVPDVWAMGDCNGKGAFTHTSYNDYEIVAANLLDHDSRRVSDRILAYNLYIDPPLGRCGMTEGDVRKSGRKALIGTMPMTKVGRAEEKGETQGFMKVLADAESKLILGASLLGVECDEVIHSILDIMYAKAPYTVIQRAMHIHPTVTELIPTLLGQMKPLE